MPRRQPKPLNLALQGGGAHGAFAWGVLDAICEDGRLNIDGISATSAGAMNAAVYAYGKLQGGFDGAREALEGFWRDISQTGSIFSPVRRSPFEWFGNALPLPQLEMATSYFWFEGFTSTFSPYEFNPLNLNPLRDVLARHVDFEALDQGHCTQLFISATNVRSNRIKIFRNEEVCADAVLASACLPMLFQAVEIDGEAYWDGGYMGNPALYPLVYHTDTADILIVHINPVRRESVPKTAAEINNRVNEISFNSSLLRELRAFDFVQRLVEEDWIKPEYRSHFKFDRLYMHQIEADRPLNDLSVASKFTPDWPFLCDLRDRGRAEAKEWLGAHFKDVGKRSSMDLREQFA